MDLEEACARDKNSRKGEKDRENFAKKKRRGGGMNLRRKREGGNGADDLWLSGKKESQCLKSLGKKKEGRRGGPGRSFEEGRKKRKGKGTERERGGEAWPYA